MKKRLLTVLLAVCLVVALGTVTAAAADETEIPVAGGALYGDYKLTADTTVSSQLTVADNSTVTIDLNGFTLSSSATGGVIKNQGTLIINDNSDEHSGTITGYRCVDNYGTLTINGGTFVGTNENIEGGWSGCIFIYADNTSVTINGGKINPDNGVNAIEFNPNAQTAGNSGFRNTTISICGGDIGNVALKGKQAELTIGNETGESTVSIKSISTPNFISNNYTIALNGGTVGKLPKYDNVDYTKTESIITDPANVPGGYYFKYVEGGWKLEKNTVEVATIGNTVYYYVPDAVKDLTNGSELTLLSDYDITNSSEIINITVPNVTIDLNGHDITVKGNIVNRPITYNVNEKGTLTIANSAESPSTITPYGSASAVYAASNNGVDVVINGNVNLVNGIQLGTGARMKVDNGNLSMLSKTENLCKVTIGGTEYVYNSSNLTAISNDAVGTESIEVTLLGDAVYGIEYAGSIPMTVDLAEFTVHDNFASINRGAVSIPVNSNSVSLTIENGSISATQAHPAVSAMSEKCTLILNNVEITSNGNYGIAGDGSKSDGLELTIANCALRNTSNSNMTTGIFFPVEGGVLTIDNSTITGYNTGVQAYAGSVTIKGAGTEITGSGVSVPNLGEDGAPATTGPIFDGSAISIIDRITEYGDFGSITIEDGSFSTETGGGENGAVHVASENAGVPGSFAPFDNSQNIVQVSGGTFTSSVSEYVTDELKAELYSAANGTYTYYSSEEAASANAKPGDIISDVKETVEYNVRVVYGNGTADTLATVKNKATFILPDTLSRNGYTFGGWRVNNSSTILKGGTTVTINNDMTFTAIWNVINIPDTYDIDLIVSDGGEAKTNLSNASAGTTITVTATPDEGYKLDYITVDGERISGTSFKMPDHDVTVRVYFTDGTSTLPFTDVRPNQWFYDAISYVYTNGMMEGDSATTFNPDGTMTRAMFWAVLGRIDGATITGTNWADQAREWAMAEGVSDGTDPNGLVTREQMVTMLWRYAGEPESSASLSAYTDAGSVSDWAETAMRWAIDEGIITGMTDTTLVPQGTATRAQCAAIFMRFDQM